MDFAEFIDWALIEVWENGIDADYAGDDYGDADADADADADDGFIWDL